MRKLISRLREWVRYQLWLRTAYVPIAGGDAIERADALSTMPEEVSNAFLFGEGDTRGLVQESAVLSQFTRIPVRRNQVRLPILSALPTGGFVGSTQGTRRKPLTKVSWDDKELDIREYAAIVPIEEDVLDDSDEPIWERVRPLLATAAARDIDAAVFFGTNAPTAWPNDIVSEAIDAGNTAEIGTAAANVGGFVKDHSDMLSEVEMDGYDPISGVASRKLRGLARAARDADGNRYAEIEIDRGSVEVDGVRYSTNLLRGQFPVGAGVPVAIAIDPDEFVVGVRQDVSWKLLDQAVLQDDQGEIVYNLAQEDMLAIRLVIRLGWQVANTINYDQPDEQLRYPAGVLTDTVTT